MTILDWAYWHLSQDTPRRVLQGAHPVLDYISPGQLPPDDPAAPGGNVDTTRYVIRAV